MSTLGRKIIWWNAGLVVGLVLLGGVAVVGLVVLGYDVRVALDEYRDRESVEKGKLRLAAARFATAPVTTEGAASELDAAIREVRQLIEAQAVGVWAQEYDARERAAAEAVEKSIQEAEAV